MDWEGYDLGPVAVQEDVDHQLGFEELEIVTVPGSEQVDDARMLRLDEFKHL